MASVSTPTPNCTIRPRTSSRSGRWQIDAVVASLLLAVGVIYGRHHLATWVAPATAVTLVLLASSFWHWHLHSSGLPAPSSFLFSLLLAAQSLALLWHHHGAGVIEHTTAYQSALGGAAFSYAMLWAFGLHDRDAGLRSLATAALLLSIGILAKPPLLICCVLLTLAIFFAPRTDEHRPAGLFNTFLLLLTPALLCAAAVMFLRTLAFEGFTLLTFRAASTSIDAAPLHVTSLDRQLPALAFCAAVLTARLLMRKTGSADLAILIMLIFLPTLGMAPWMPLPLSLLDISMILSWSVASLLALDPPIPILPRLVAFAGAVSSLYFCR